MSASRPGQGRYCGETAGLSVKHIQYRIGAAAILRRSGSFREQPRHSRQLLILLCS